MPNKNYLRGRRWEYEIITRLLKGASSEAWGQRMAGSHSPFDIIFFDPSFKQVVLVQAKTKKGKVGLPVVSELKSMKDWSVITYKWTKSIK